MKAKQNQLQQNDFIFKIGIPFFWFDFFKNLKHNYPHIISEKGISNYLFTVCRFIGVFYGHPS